MTASLEDGKCGINGLFQEHSDVLESQTKVSQSATYYYLSNHSKALC